MKKQIANIVTGCRILCSVCLLFFPVFSVYYYILYLLCGLTDMVDGTIARKTNTASQFGAKLDTVADIIFLTVSLFKLLPEIHMQTWLWIWIGIIAVIKVCTHIWGIIRLRKIISLHTVANKITGLCLFLFPFTLLFMDLQYSAPAVCAIATFSAVEEGYYIGTGLEIL